MVERKQALVIVHHPQHGDIAEAEDITSRLRRAVVEAARDGTPAVYHDATAMESATPAYASAFKDLEKDIAGEVGLVVCAIPRAVLRVLARSVAFVARKPWVIVGDADEAKKRLEEAGYSLA